MTSHLPRPSAVILSSAISGALVLGLTGCAPTAETSKGVPTTAPVASSVPTASSAAVVSAVPASGPAPASNSEARNPAAMDGAVAYSPVIDPANFVEVVDNPYWPLTPGAAFEFEGGGEQIKIAVTSERRTIMGVSTVVVTDKVYVDGKLAEDTSDWYAQDRAGNVWYFGEATLSYEDDPNGNPAGSWEGGIDGALPGVVMLADPVGGDVYRQEFYAGHAEDLALVRHATGSIKVPAGSYDGLLVTEEWSPLEPDVIELKYYAKGIGLVAERQIFGGKDLVELVKVTPAP